MNQVSKKLSSVFLMIVIKCFVIICAIVGFAYAMNNIENLELFIIITILIVIIAIVILYKLTKIEDQRKVRLHQQKQLKDSNEEHTRKIELFEKLKNSQNLRWSDIVDVTKIGFSYDANAIYQIIAQANIMDLISVSKIKTQLYWKQDSLDAPLNAIETVFKNCFDDRILEPLVEQFKIIDQYKGYDGYKTLTKKITSYKHIAKCVTFKNNSIIAHTT